MRSGFHVTDSYLGNTLQSEMDDYQSKNYVGRKVVVFGSYCLLFQNKWKNNSSKAVIINKKKCIFYFIFDVFFFWKLINPFHHLVINTKTKYKIQYNSISNWSLTKRL
jgi:hypothetical protein